MRSVFIYIFFVDYSAEEHPKEELSFHIILLNSNKGKKTDYRNDLFSGLINLDTNHITAKLLFPPEVGKQVRYCGDLEMCGQSMPIHKH